MVRYITIPFILFSMVSCRNMNDGSDLNKPNILILYADDMGYGDLGVQNPASKIPTTNLDRLAGEG
jgi:arylsulfatase A